MTEGIQYRLPDGRTTISARIYVREWRRLAKAICEATGAEVYGYDPGLGLRINSVCFNLPALFALRLSASLTRRSKPWR